MSFAASLPLNSPTTRSSKAVVAIAHGLEFRICRRLRSLAHTGQTGQTLMGRVLQIAILRNEVLDRGVYRRALQRLEVRGQAGRLYRRALHGNFVAKLS